MNNNLISIKPTADTCVTITYSEFVGTLVKKFPDEPRLAFCHSAMGVAGEAGELCDAIKRHAIYGNEPDIINIVEELGDLEFYMEDIRSKYNISRQQTLQHNADKLAKRYKGLVYSDGAAIARADKVTGYQEHRSYPESEDVVYYIANSDEDAKNNKFVAGPFNLREELEAAMVDGIICERKRIVEGEYTTEYLLKSKANSAHLTQSVEQLKSGDVTEQKLIEDEDDGSSHEANNIYPDGTPK